MAEAMIECGVFRGPEGPRFYRNARRSLWARRACDLLATAIDLPGSTYRRHWGPSFSDPRLSKSNAALVEKAVAHAQPTGLPDSTCRRHWEPCHWSKKSP